MIRDARPGDVPALHAMVRDLAEHHDVTETEATDEQLHEALFGPHPSVFALVAEAPDDPEPAGFALWFRNFSTWTGTHGVYLEDLFVRPEHRGAGYGKALMAALAAVCVERGYDRFEWSVHEENKTAAAIYEALGAVPKDTWTGYRLSGPALRGLASSHSVNHR
ncbi:GNAT family N-acetyltransferase [Streptomyces sp. NPDC051940]|uniref:GNAT family N-acetyltransferase n=1 Tax=Streptomyces sp. NPDC051940 TaxID=3155675 RepID=UPI003446913D